MRGHRIAGAVPVLTTIPPVRPESTSLAFQGIVRHFRDVRVLDGVSGAVAPGEVLLVRGPNGSGKSTLLRCLAGLLRPQSGSVTLIQDGRELDAAERRTAVGYIAPDLAFYEPLTARENLELFAKIRGVDVARGGRLLAETGVPPDRAVRVLSSGQRQRLRWSWALLHEPTVLLLDEPFQNLDDEGTDRLVGRLEEHRRGGGITVVASPSGIGRVAPSALLDLAPASPGGAA